MGLSHIFSDVWSCIGLAILLFILSIHYFFTYSIYSYWSKRNVKGPTPWPIIGNSLDFVFWYNFDVHRGWYNKYGKIFGYFSRGTPVLSIGDPTIVRQILVKDFAAFPDHFPEGAVGHPVLDDNITYTHGDQWKKIRFQFASSLSPQRIRAIVPSITSSFQNRMDALLDEVKENGGEKVVNILQAVALICADMIWQTMLTSKMEPSDEGRIVETCRQLFARQKFRYILSIICPFFFKTPLFIWKDVDNLFEITTKVLEDRRKDLARGTYDDFTDRMLDCQESGDEKKKFTESELISQMALTIASSENITGVLTLLLAKLARNPRIQTTLFEESKGKLDDADTILSLPYLDATIKETMRFYPGDVALNRTALRDYRLPGTNITVPKGMIVTIPLCAIQTDPLTFKDPFAFRPERFLENEVEENSYLPFGIGPRTCAGKPFSIIALKLILAQFLHRFEVKEVLDLNLSDNHFITYTPTRAVMRLTIRQHHI